MLMGVFSGLLTAAAFGMAPRSLAVFFSLVPLFYSLLRCKNGRQLKYILFPFALALHMPMMSFLYMTLPVLPVSKGWGAVLVTLAAT